MTTAQGFTWGMIATTGIPLALVAFAIFAAFAIGGLIYLIGYSRGYDDGVAITRYRRHSYRYFIRPANERSSEHGTP